MAKPENKSNVQSIKSAPAEPRQEKLNELTLAEIDTKTGEVVEKPTKLGAELTKLFENARVVGAQIKGPAVDPTAIVWEKLDGGLPEVWDPKRRSEARFGYLESVTVIPADGTRRAFNVIVFAEPPHGFAGHGLGRFSLSGEGNLSRVWTLRRTPVETAKDGSQSGGEVLLFDAAVDVLKIQFGKLVGIQYASKIKTARGRPFKVFNWLVQQGQ